LGKNEQVNPSAASNNSWVYRLGRTKAITTGFSHRYPNVPHAAVIVFHLPAVPAVTNIRSFPIMVNGFT
jgi:hypothetical protein